jgi:hypothetical protein
MTFFYDLNKKLDEIRATPSTTHGQLNERDEGKPGKNFEKIAKDAGERYGSKAAGERVAGAVRNKLKAQGKLEEEGMSRAAKGYEKYGKEGMEALAKAGREGKALDPIRAKYDKYDESMEEGLGDVAKKIGGAVKKVASKALDTLGHGSDEDMIRDLQKKAGMPQHGKKSMAQPNEGAAPMSAKQKSFAALAEPKDKITFADKIAGAKKEVDEMLGDVAAEAMKDAVNRKIAGKRYGGAAQKDDDLQVKPEAPRGRGRPKKSTDTEQGADLKPDWSAFGVGKVKLPAHKGAVTKHTLSDKEPSKVKESDNESDDIKQAMAMLKKAGYKVTKAADGAEQVDEKAVSKKQQKFMGMVHATQKGEKAPSKEVAKVAKSMGKKDAEDFAATKHKGLPEKKKSEGKKKEVEETSDNKSSGGMSFGKGIYDSMNRELETMIAESMSRLDESMSINMSMNNDDMQGGARQTLTVTATDEDAAKLGALLKMAGLGGGQQEGGCGSNAEVVDENQPDWPTNTETSDDAMQYSGGLNKPKATGQTTIPVIASQDDRQHSYAEAEEDDIKRMMEMAGIQEAKGKKPDFLDVDKDGDKKEPFKKAVDDKKEKQVDEGILSATTNLWKAYKG